MKRSAHVALLLMGTTAVGGTAYTMMPGENCTADRSGISADSSSTECSRESSSSSSGSSYHSSWFSSRWHGFHSSSPSTTAASSSVSGDAGSSHVSRGGFGSFVHSLASHFSRGG